MSDMPSEEYLGERQAQMALVAKELDGEVASHVARAAAMEQRATILIGAASVVGALQVTTEFSFVTISNLILSFLAAAAGVVVVFPRRGDALNVRNFRKGVLDMSALQGQYVLIDTKLEILESDERWLSIRGWIARFGFIFLAASIAVALVGALSAKPAPGDPNPSPSPTLSSPTT